MTVPNGAVVEDSTVDCIYINIHAESDFRIFRIEREGPVEDELLGVAADVAAGCYKILTITTTRSSNTVVFLTTLSKQELQDRGFPFRGSR